MWDCLWCDEKKIRNPRRHVMTKHPKELSTYDCSGRRGPKTSICSPSEYHSRQYCWSRKSRNNSRKSGKARFRQRTPNVSPEVIKLISTTKSLVIFTGAGISVSSGIPQFRGPNGIHNSYIGGSSLTGKDAFFFENAMLKPEEFWKVHGLLQKKCTEAKPSITHHWIRFISESGRCAAVYNQNIDGLLERIQTDEDILISLHKSYSRCRCTAGHILGDDVASYYEAMRNENWESLKCPSQVSSRRVEKKCGAQVIPDILYFYDRDTFDIGDKVKSHQIENLEVLLVLGTSFSISSFVAIIISYQNMHPTSKLVVVDVKSQNDVKIPKRLRIDHWIQCTTDQFVSTLEWK